MAFKLWAELKNIVSVGEALDTLGRLVDYIRFRPLETDKASVNYDSMAVRDLGINASAVKLVKFFQEIVKTKDPSATMYIQLIKHYFLNAYDWSNIYAEGYEDFENDALWFCDEMEDYLRSLRTKEDKSKKNKPQSTGNEMVLRRRLHME